VGSKVRVLKITLMIFGVQLKIIAVVAGLSVLRCV
jgi:hypothetical protein